MKIKETGRTIGMVNNICSVCGEKRDIYFNRTVLDKFSVNYYYCVHCGLLQTEQPYWLDEAYNNAIVAADTGLVQRNLYNSQILTCLFYYLFNKQGKYLDVGGGYGLLTRLMRDYGFDFYWTDKYCENILAQGFDLTTTNPPFTAITAFEVLEHVYDPLSFIMDCLNNFETKTIIFSTEIFDGPPPKPEDWWYYCFNTGQHITFYQQQTLKYIARKIRLNLYSNKTIHIFTDKTIKLNKIQLLMGRLSFILFHCIKNNRSNTLLDHVKLMQSFTNY